MFQDGTVQHRQSDAVGNLFRTREQNDRRYGRGGRLERANGTDYRYDEHGNLIEKTLADGAKWRYVWTTSGRLQAVTRPDGQQVLFSYDALGRRIRKEFGGAVTEYVWDGNDLVHERVVRGDDIDPVVTWLFEPGTFAPAAKFEGKKRYAIVNDYLGTPSAPYTEAGELAWKAQLDIYGVPREDRRGIAEGNATGNPWRYPGQYEDAETGLYYNRFRYYNPETGRYISEDPIGLAGGTALYGYVHDPLGWVDPWGLSFKGPARKSTQWGHIFEGHWFGSSPKLLSKNDVFGTLSKNEIMGVADEAWRLKKRIGTRGPRIKFEAIVKTRTWRGRIEMWFNRESRVLESAYPTKPKSGCR